MTAAVSGVRPAIDLSTAGLRVQAFVALEVDLRALLRIIEELQEIPQILKSRAQAGLQDLILVVAEDYEKLQQLTAEIAPGRAAHQHDLETALNPIGYRLKPVLEQLTRGGGWGRSTPARR